MTQLTPATSDKPMFGAITLALVAAILMFAEASTARAQWTTPNAANNINNTNTGNVGIGTTVPDSLLTVNANTSGLQAPGSNFPGTLFHVSGADNAKARLLFDAFGSGFTPQLTYRYARGTAAAPSAVQAGDALGQITASGYKATSYTPGSRATITFLAAENWNDTANGTAISFTTTVNGGSTPVEGLRIIHSGSVGVGTTNPVFDANVSRFLSVDGGAGAMGSIGAAGGTNSTGTGIGQFAFVNSTLGTTDKRVATIVGSTDTATNSGTLDLYTSNAGTWGLPKMRIMSGGNIGIGAWSPGFRLDVQGGQINSSGGLCIAGVCKGSWSEVGGSQWSTGGSSAIYYNTGNVGIGTATPDSLAKLHLSGSGGLGQDIQTTTNDWTRLRFITPARTMGLFLDGGSAGLGTGKFGLYDYTAGGWRLVADTNGNVGIGTTTPNKSAVSKAFTLNGSTDAVYELAIADVRKGTLYHDGTELSVNNNANGAMVLRTNNTERLRIDSSGNVGIGMAPTTKRLEVAGDLNASGAITGGTINAKYQDVAEWVHSSQQLTAGTVVVLDHTKSNQVIASSQAYDMRVAGVISLQPGISLGENGLGKVLVATTGRVRIKVDASHGSIHVGDLLVTSNVPGLAMKSQPIDVGGVQIHRPGTLIGKALEPLDKSIGEILVLLSLQ